MKISLTRRINFLTQITIFQEITVILINKKFYIIFIQLKLYKFICFMQKLKIYIFNYCEQLTETNKKIDSPSKYNYYKTIVSSYDRCAFIISEMTVF